MIPLLNTYNGSSGTHINHQLYNELVKIFTLNSNLEETIAAINNLESTQIESHSDTINCTVYAQPGISAYLMQEDVRYRMVKGGIIAFKNSNCFTISLSPEDGAEMAYIMDKLCGSFTITFDRFGRRSGTNPATTIRFKGNVTPNGYYLTTDKQNGTITHCYNWIADEKKFQYDEPTMWSGSKMITLTYGKTFDYAVEPNINTLLPAVVETINSAFVSR